MNPRSIITKDEFKAGIAVVLFALFIIILVQNSTILSNQDDIDKRLTRIEQDNSERDKAQIELFQRLNEAMYDQVWIRRDIRILQNIVGE